jgi:hypothetical protein
MSNIQPCTDTATALSKPCRKCGGRGPFSFERRGDRIIRRAQCKQCVNSRKRDSYHTPEGIAYVRAYWAARSTRTNAQAGIDKIIDMTGMVIGRLTVLGRAPDRVGRRPKQWACICACGNRVTVCGTMLRRRSRPPTRSCGCLSIADRTVPPGEPPLGCRFIPLTRGKLAIVDEADYAELMMFRWHTRVARTAHHTQYYAMRCVHRRGQTYHIGMHQHLLPVPAGKEVDHKDRDGLNNRRGNLRPCSRQENSFNTRRYSPTKTSVLHGVSRRRDVLKITWVARLARRHLGSFGTQEEAARAYDHAAINTAGEFAAPNFKRYLR